MRRGEFTNVQNFDDWSGTEIVTGHDPWCVFPGIGLQGGGPHDNALHAVAVRPGEMTASVPDPHTLALALLALGATVVTRRRRSC